MDTGRAFWVICITLVVINILNVGIYAAFSKRKPDSFSATFGKAAREIHNPWGQQDARMTELSERIAELRKNAPPNDDAAENQGNHEPYG